MPGRLRAVVLTAALLSCAAASAAGPDTLVPGATVPPGMERIASVEGVTEYRLDNGLRVLLASDPSQSRTQVNLVYLAGSRHERDGATGVAHLLEHMMFKGTATHPEVLEELAAHGVSISAGTQYDHTSYASSFASDPDTLAWVLDLEADRMVGALLREQDLATEITVVRNEFERNENSALRVLKQRVRSTAYLWHSYGNAIIGARSDLEQMPVGRLREFYEAYYRPDNAVLILAGGFDTAVALRRVRASFGPIPRPARAVPRTYTREPAQDGPRLAILRRAGEGGAAVAAYHVPAGAHPDYAAVRVLNELLSAVPGGRGHRALVETGKATAVMVGSINPPLHDPYLLWLVATTRDGADAQSIRDLLVATIERMAEVPPSEGEVERARTELLAGIDLTLRSALRTGRALGGWAAAGDWRLLFLHRDRLREVDASDVQRVAATYLLPSNRTVGLFVPDDAPRRVEVPEVADITGMVRDYAGDPTYSAGEAFDPAIANIQSRIVYATRGGVRLAMVPKRTRARTVSGTLVLNFGDPRSLAGRGMAGELAGGLLVRGTRSRTRQDIQETLDALRTIASVTGDADSATAQFDTTREHLPAVLALVAEILREPAFPADEFELLKQSRLSELEKARGEPLPLAIRVLQRRMQPHAEGDPRHIASIDAEIAAVEAMTLAQVRDFHDDFYGASQAELALVGDFDPDQAAEQVKRLFGDWQGRSAHAPLSCAHRPVPASMQVLRTPDKANAIFRAAQNLDLAQDDPDWPALMIAGEILGGGFMSSRLAERLRQQEGLSYSATAQFDAPSTGRCGRFSASAIVAPQNMEKLEQAFDEEIARVLRDGFTATELQSAKEAWLRQRPAARASDPALARTLASYLRLGRTLSWDVALEEAVRALTLEQVDAALRRHLDPTRFNVVKAGDLGADE